MSILFVLLMFLLIISVRYFIEPKHQPALEPEIVAKPRPPLVKREYGFEIPQGYCFHLGHMWAMKEGTEDARVGVDKFVTNLLGKIDHIDVCGANRWVRQGQKLITLTSNGTSVDLLSPVEGVVMAINNDALREPSLVTNDPYENGWIAMDGGAPISGLLLRLTPELRQQVVKEFLLS
jgi:glycine cleavage system H lipoate-binding protein